MESRERVVTEAEYRADLRAMGEPPSSVEYLMRTIYFDGEAVVVPAPSRNYPNTETGD